MNFNRAAVNFSVLITVAILLLVIDLIKWQSGGTTWSEAVWEVNQVTLSTAFAAGLVCGHCFTVPKSPK